MSHGTVARAFELARAGSCRNLDHIRRQLKSEGYASISEHLDGPSIKKQLAALIKTSTGNTADNSEG